MNSVENSKAYGLLSVLQRGGLTLKEIAARSGVAYTTLCPFRDASTKRMATATYEKLLELYQGVRSDPGFQNSLNAWRIGMEAREKLAAESKPQQGQLPASQPEAEEAPAPKPSAQGAPDVVNHPSHYERVAVKVEPMHLTAHLPHPLASAFEYLIRAGFKDGQSEATDLRKACFWLKFWLDDKESTDFKISRINFARAVLFGTVHCFVRELLEPIIDTMHNFNRSCMDFPLTVTKEEMAIGVTHTIEAVEKRLTELEQMEKTS